jgi:S1-C subfamily serine protease
MTPPEHSRLPAGGTSGGFLSFLALGLSVFLLAFVMWSRGDLTFGTPVAEPRAIAARGDLSAHEQTTIEIFERTSPSVVNVSHVDQVRISPWLDTVEERPTEAGTGFVWDTAGHIVTNFHVIFTGDRDQPFPDKFSVTLEDQRYDATLVGIAPEKDLAVLKIDAAPQRLQPLPLGTSHDLQVGQTVLAIGNPFGLDQTLTVGVISALNRSIRSPTEARIDGVVQTDAAINPGNSGGPLLDSAGRLIGVNTMIISRSGNSAGIGFAVPVDVVNRVVPELVVHGRVTRPVMGVILDDNNRTPRSVGLEGCHIREVLASSAADEAGLLGIRQVGDDWLRGDIILEVGRLRTRNKLDVVDALAQYSVGDRVRFVVDRLGETLEFDVTLQALK